jgi:hypothetical protein
MHFKFIQVEKQITLGMSEEYRHTSTLSEWVYKLNNLAMSSSLFLCVHAEKFQSYVQGDINKDACYTIFYKGNKAERTSWWENG